MRLAGMSLVQCAIERLHAFRDKRRNEFVPLDGLAELYYMHEYLSTPNEVFYSLDIYELANYAANKAIERLKTGLPPNYREWIKQ